MTPVSAMDLRDAERADTLPFKPSNRHSVATLDGDEDHDQDELAAAVSTTDADTLARLLAAKTLELEQLQRTHDEYVKSSCEYERELETEVDRYEKKTQQLQVVATQLERDKNELHESVGGGREELEQALSRERALQAQVHEMKWRIQRLEQDNDELETAARIAQATIDDLQHKSEAMLEQNVFLQHEKEELQREFSSIIIAEVHPSSAAVVAANSAGSVTTTTIGRVPSFRLSRKASSHAVMEAAVSLAHNAQENLQKGRKRRGRYPEVLESCIHLTCRKCRANTPHGHNAYAGKGSYAAGKALPGASERGSDRSAVLAFFERLRLLLFGPEQP